MQLKCSPANHLLQYIAKLIKYFRSTNITSATAKVNCEQRQEKEEEEKKNSHPDLI